MVSKLPIIWKQTVQEDRRGDITIAAFDPYGRWAAHPRHVFNVGGKGAGAATKYTIPRVPSAFSTTGACTINRPFKTMHG